MPLLCPGSGFHHPPLPGTVPPRSAPAGALPLRELRGRSTRRLSALIAASGVPHWSPPLQRAPFPALVGPRLGPAATPGGPSTPPRRRRRGGRRVRSVL